MEEAKRKIKNCLEKEEAFCASACPFHIDIREFISRMQRGGYNAAFRTFSNTVGFPGIVAELCGEPCKMNCPGNKEGRAVDIKGLEKAAMKYAVNINPNSYNMPQKDKSIAIIGAGISGLACALRLTNRKYNVTVYEKSGRIGGHLWDVMPYSVFLSDIERQFMYEKYTLHLNTAIDSIDSLKADAVYIATGIDGSDFGMGKDHDTNPFASVRPGVFIGGSILRADSMEAIACGLKAALIIENYLKTGNMKNLEPGRQTKMCLDPSARIQSDIILPSDGSVFTKEEAVAEAKRCIKCKCDACVRHCDLMSYFEKFPERIEEEVEVTIHPGTLDGNGTVATRFISTCSQCGLCKEVCPSGIDVGDFLLQSHRAMREKGAMPWVFHDFYLRDMEFANGERAALTLMPKGYSKVQYMFFPGCQLGASDKSYVTESYRCLLKNIPDTSLVLGCCGAPAVWAGDEAMHQKALSKIKQEWEDAGKPKVIFACPTCKSMFEKYLPEIEGLFLYDLLSEFGISPSADGKGEYASIFDPCSSRHKPLLQQNIRKLAEKAGYNLKPLPYERKFAQCCSWGGHISIANPPYTKWMVGKRISEGNTPYITYCSNCRDIFAKAGKPAVHILDILFGLNDWDRKPPTFSERRRNREQLKIEILREFCGEENEREDMNDDFKLTIDQRLKEKINKEMLLEEDVIKTVEHCEESGRKVINPSNGHLSGYMEIGHLTYWVEYVKTEEGFELINAYSHRMKIELEEVWNGRKQ